MPELSSHVISQPLPDDFSIAKIFPAFSKRPGCLWLDSSSAGKPFANRHPSSGGSEAAVTSGDEASRSEHAADQHPFSGQLDRYSFLTSDPVDVIVAQLGDPDPWPELLSWCQKLSSVLDPELPPFQGGIAGLIGYEAVRWIEEIDAAAHDDLPTPAISMGLYDWCIACDHAQQKTWIIVRNICPTNAPPQKASLVSRLETVRRWVDAAMQEKLTASGVNRHAPAGVTLGHHGHATDHHGVVSNFRPTEFRDSVAEIVQRIRRGDSFQVNLAQRLLAPASCDSWELYLRLRDVNPATFAAYFGGDGFDVLSSSPEGFLKLRDGTVETRPIKGTVSRSGEDALDDRLAQQLTASEKDRAENVMIVDLMRNDLSRVCQNDSVRVTQLCSLETYQYVQHLVSVVQGKLGDGENAVTLLKACFPGGSVTGAPKVEAMRTIAELEPHRRGPYCGSIGYISAPDTADFNILIRTITATGGLWQIPVGGGITARSQPAAEEAETWTKAEGMLRALD